MFILRTYGLLPRYLPGDFHGIKKNSPGKNETRGVLFNQKPAMNYGWAFKYTNAIRKRFRILLKNFIYDHAR